MMKQVLKLLRRPWLISLVGIIGLAVLIWFFASLIEVSDRPVLASVHSRIIAIAVLFGLWGLNQLRKWLISKRTDDALVEGVVNGPADEGIDTLRESLAEAMAKLRKNGNRLGQRYLYQLPWYAIIGPPGAGKTTALKNSDLALSSAGKRAGADIQGRRGTRNCDWFFADQAVLLDTAGRYATQDSDTLVDASEWQGFLELLRTHRPRRPLNGVIVAVSVSELLEQDVAGRKRHADLIRDRIDELQDAFQMQLPIYIWFTKCDLLPGFTEFFADLDEESRKQVWGVTLPEDCIDAPEGVSERLENELEKLEQRLLERVLGRIGAEPNASEKRQALIYAFPAQFGVFRRIANQFVRQVARGTRHDDDMLLRGAYFVSGTQTGIGLDRLLASLSKTLGVVRSVASQAKDTGISYFTSHLLRDVIFAEQDLAGTNLSLERRRAFFQHGLRLAAVAGFAIAAVVLFVSFSHQAHYVRAVRAATLDVRTVVGELDEEKWAIADVLPALNAARDLPIGQVTAGTSSPWLLDFPFRTHSRLAQESETTYRRLLVEQFRPRVWRALELQMAS
ncbi:MAG: type VI secretion system membrane subunit TssM [Pseudomonadota bacterium]